MFCLGIQVTLNEKGHRKAVGWTNSMFTKQRYKIRLHVINITLVYKNYISLYINKDLKLILRNVIKILNIYKYINIGK